MPEKRVSYQPLKQSAHNGFLVKAPSMQRLYIDCALALTDMRVAQDLILESEFKEVIVNATNTKNLMIAWLNEIILLFEKEQFLAKRIVFKEFTEKKIISTLTGEKYIPVKHGHVSDLKTLTTDDVNLGNLDESENNFYAKVFTPWRKT